MKNILKIAKHIPQAIILPIPVHQILIQVIQEVNHMLLRMELNQSIPLIIIKSNILVVHNLVEINIMDGIIQMIKQMI